MAGLIEGPTVALPTLLTTAGSQSSAAAGTAAISAAVIWFVALRLQGCPPGDSIGGSGNEGLVTCGHWQRQNCKAEGWHGGEKDQKQFEGEGTKLMRTSISRAFSLSAVPKFLRDGTQ